MKSPLYFMAAILLAAHLSAQTIQIPPAPKDVKVVGSGLTYLAYPLQPSQITSNNYNGYIAYSDLLKLKPPKAPRTIYSLTKWEKPVDDNAVVVGYLKIEKAGTYAFMSASGFDRNELIINDTVVCKFRDGEKKGVLVELPQGLFPIVSVGYPHSTSEVRVQWMPPGTTTWSEIPKNLLYRTAVEIPK